jgi:hypothetical protein
MKQFTIVIALLVVGGCTTTTSLSLDPQAGQELVYDNGMPLAISVSDRTTVAFGLSEKVFENNTNLKFTVMVHNNSDSSILFDDGQITAQLDAPRDINKKIIKVYSYDELMADIKKKEQWAAVAAALGAVGNSMSASTAGRSTTTGTYSGTASTGVYSSTTYDPAVARAASDAADEKNQKLFDDVKNNAQAQRQHVDGVLRDHTVSPGSWHSGHIFMSNPGSSVNSKITVQIVFGEDIHVFDVIQRKN